MSGYNDDRVAYLNGILTTGNADAAVAVQASHQKILAEIQLCKRDISYGRFLTDRKFQCFCIAIQNMIKSFYIAADAVLSGADILQDIISSDIFRVDDTSDIQGVDDIIKFQTVDLGNQLGIGDAFGKEGKKYILLIQIRQCDKGFGLGKSFFEKKRTVRSVTIDDSRIRKQFA